MPDPGIGYGAGFDQASGQLFILDKENVAEVKKRKISGIPFRIPEFGAQVFTFA